MEVFGHKWDYLAMNGTIWPPMLSFDVDYQMHMEVRDTSSPASCAQECFWQNASHYLAK